MGFAWCFLNILSLKTNSLFTLTNFELFLAFSFLIVSFIYRQYQRIHSPNFFNVHNTWFYLWHLIGVFFLVAVLIDIEYSFLPSCL